MTASMRLDKLAIKRSKILYPMIGFFVVTIIRY